jgi:hypothetical protein
VADHITLQFVGLAEAAIAIDRWGRDVQQQARHELVDEVDRTVREIKARVPKSRGNVGYFKDVSGKRVFVEGDRIADSIKSSVVNPDSRLADRGTPRWASRDIATLAVRRG